MPDKMLLTKSKCFLMAQKDHVASLEYLSGPNFKCSFCCHLPLLRSLVQLPLIAAGWTLSPLPLLPYCGLWPSHSQSLSVFPYKVFCLSLRLLTSLDNWNMLLELCLKSTQKSYCPASVMLFKLNMDVGNRHKVRCRNTHTNIVIRRHSGFTWAWEIQPRTK